MPGTRGSQGLDLMTHSAKSIADILRDSIKAHGPDNPNSHSGTAPQSKARSNNPMTRRPQRLPDRAYRLEPSVFS